MITPKTIPSKHFLSAGENTIESNEGSLFITSFESAGVVAIDDLAIQASPCYFYSPIRCNKFTSFDVPFTFYYYGRDPRGSITVDPCLLPAQLPMYLC